MTPSRPVHQTLQDIFDARVQTLTTPHRYYRVAAHRFLAYLQTDFPQVLQLSQLRRDPHLLGWICSLAEQAPPLSYSTRRIYLVGLRRLLHDFACEGHSLPPGLILSEDFPLPPQSQRKLRRPNDQCLPLIHPIFGEIFEAHLQTLTTTLRPRTIYAYRGAARRFLSYLQTDFPHVLGLSDLHRDPHLLGWFRCLDEQNLSPRSRQKRLLNLRRLLRDLASAGYRLQPGLFLPEDFPLHPRLQQELRSTNDRCSPLSQLVFGEIFEVHVKTLATTLRPSTTRRYRVVACHFLSYLQTDFPEILQLSELRRDPHLFGWFRRLCEQNPPLSNGTRRYYLVNLRRLLYDLSNGG